MNHKFLNCQYLVGFMIQCSHTVESVEFMAANFCVNYGYFAYSWGYNFLDASAFSFSKKVKYF